MGNDNRTATINASASSEKIRVRALPHSKDVADVVKWYYIKSLIATKLPWKKAAWATAAFPVELLWTFDIFPLHPENKAVEATLYKQSLKMIEHAESMGYSRDICSYCKTSIGAFDADLDVKIGGIQKPHMICATNTICDTHWKWFQLQGHKLDLPVFIFDVPSDVSGSDENTIEGYLDYIVDQMYDFFDFVKKHTGRKFNEKRYQKIIEKSDYLSMLWHRIFEYRKQVPAPYSLTDALLALFPLVMLNGVDRGISFYEKLVADVGERVSKKEGVLPQGKEKYRLIWEGIPFWHRTKFYYELANYGAVVAYEPYTYSFAPRKTAGLGVRDSLRELAKIMLDIPYNLNLEKRTEYFKKIIKEYNIDGVIMHENMSCRPSATGMVDLKNAIQRECRVPVLLLQGDHADPRAYSEAQVKVRVESFIELMEDNKRSK